MRHKLIVILFLFFISAPIISAQAKSNALFLQNIGQVRDEKGNVRKDIDYVMHTSELSLYIGKGKLVYQWIRNQRACRIESCLKGCNPVKPIVTDTQPYVENYYENSKLKGIAHSCKKIIYKDVYPNIDWILKVNEAGDFEYEFVLGPQARREQIEIEYKGYTQMQLDENGDLLLTCPLGYLREKAPETYTQSGQLIASRYRLIGSKLYYDIHDYRGALVIDPKVVWATYYGDPTAIFTYPSSYATTFTQLACDAKGNVYGVGNTGAIKNIATSGAYQTTLKANIGSMQDLFYVKFDSLGNRLYATYFGSAGYSTANPSIAVSNDTVYLGGSDRNGTLATPGAEQSSIPSSFTYAPFIAKFNHSGLLQWCTYVGGENSSQNPILHCDNANHLYILMGARDNDAMGTLGTFRTHICDSTDGFLAKYSSEGKKIWGTYMGGRGNDIVTNLTIMNDDGTGSIYAIGQTTSDTGIATSGAYQVSKRGINDMFLVKFDTSGKRIWGTYIGGDSLDAGLRICQDNSRSLYVIGNTYSTNGIATAGAYRTRYAGNQDIALLKFGVDGSRVWGTYIGGSGQDNPTGICTDKLGNIYISGSTNTTDSLVDTAAFGRKYSGGVFDGLLMGFDAGGRKIWMSYYGGEGYDYLNCVASDGSGLYAAGFTDSKTGIATKGSFIDSNAGRGAAGIFGFLLKVGEPNLSFKTSKVTEEIQTPHFLKLYPNPVSEGVVTISGKMEGEKNMDISVYDIQGKLLFHQTMNLLADGTLLYTLNVSLYASGMYFVKGSVAGIEQVISFEKK